MVRFERRMGMKPGKEREAQQWIKEIADYINAKFAPPELHVFAPQFGPEDLFTIVQSMDFGSLAEMEQFMGRLAADAGFQQINARGPEVAQRPVITTAYTSIL